jgi:hypothetical protein
VQTFAVPPTQAPAWQASFSVQGLPSSHAVPLAFTGLEHTPVAVLHTPAVWHWSGTGHTTGFPPVQTPAWHVSVWVQAFPSVHAVPSALFGSAGQSPVARLQTTAVWHWFGTGQVTAAPVHTPAWQVSPVVQRLPSLQAVPLALFVAEQTPVAGLQVGTLWHWSGAGPQLTVVWPMQVPF